MIAALREAWIWLLLAFILGVVIGYFLRKWTVRDSESTTTSSASSELEASLASEREARAKAEAELDACRKASASAAPVALAAGAAVAAPVATKPAAKAPVKKAPATKASAAKPAAALDLAAAKAAIGATVKLDDLTVVEGIGPKIAGLIKADGITTWRALSETEVSRLQRILDEAGPRYNIHDPGSWPKQAGLLADGKWARFVKLTDSLKGGK